MSALARNYDPLDVTLTHGEGVYVTDVEGKRYLDCIAGYSALSFGHRHPALIEAAKAQLDRLTLTSRALKNDLLPTFAERVAGLTGYGLMLPMNTGAEAVETMIKAARKWGYQVKGVAADSAEIIVAEGSFHGRTTTIVSFSTDPEARDGFGPYTPGFTVVPFGDAEAIASAITPNTVGVLIEPIQGEAGIVVPPEGYLTLVRELCSEAGVLMLADEIQSGLGRTGFTLHQDSEHIRADLTALGKALSGGILPVSAVVGAGEVLGVLTPSTHGSTYGGNPLAAAVGIAVVDLLETGEFQHRARTLSPVLFGRAEELQRRGLLTGVRGAGLWLGVDIADRSGRRVSTELARRGVLAKETHGNTIRFAPPLTITEQEIHTVMDALESALTV